MTNNLVKNITIVTGLAVIGFAGNGCRSTQEHIGISNPNAQDFPQYSGDQDGITSENKTGYQEVTFIEPSGDFHRFKGEAITIPQKRKNFQETIMLKEQEQIQKQAINIQRSTNGTINNL